MSGNNSESTDEFDRMMADDEIEVAGAPATEQEPAKPEKAKAAPKAAGKEPAKVDGTDTDADDSDAEDSANVDPDAEDEDGKKPEKTARDHQIERLKREKAELARQLRESSNSDLARRLENLEKGLQPKKDDANDGIGKSPDPTDTEKYPLGHLDDRYIEDKLEWLAERKAADRADAVLQRQQEQEQAQAFEQEREALLEKVDEIATRGADISDDFQEIVVDAGMRGDWPLQQATFEAAHEAEHGAQILYELAQDKKEAARVAKLSNYQQMKFVQERDAEISQGKKPRRIPGAGAPPQNPARGANSRTNISPGTDNLDDFEKAWANDAKRG